MLRTVLLASLAAGCTNGGETITPLVTADTTNLHFTQNLDDGIALEYQLDVQAMTLTGFTIDLQADQSLCRRRVEAAHGLPNPAPLTIALDASQLSTLTGDACSRVLGGCGGLDTSFGVQVDGGDRYTTKASMCETLLADEDLTGTLAAAFESLSPTAERVAWIDGGYAVVGSCD